MRRDLLSDHGTDWYDVTAKPYPIFTCILHICLGIVAVMFVMFPISVISLKFSARRPTKKLRVALFRSILRQDISWYDTNKPGELNTRLTE